MYKTDQEKFWSGDFGNNYINRNSDYKLMSASINMFGKILESCSDVSSVLEVGPNIGINLDAIRLLKPEFSFSAVEINKTAVDILKEKDYIEVYHNSILDFESTKKWDLVFTRGVLIHISPDELERVYEKLYETTNKYIVLAEYYNPVPVAIDYRGEKDKLFKRDFAGDLLKKYDDLELVNYGFEYRHDNNFPNDDITWFVLRKKGV